MEDAPEPDPDFEPVTFDLAKGTKVRVAIGKYWEQISATDRALGIQPTLYLAIRIYSDEDTYPRRLTHHDEFRAKHDFAPSVLQRLHLWLADLAVSRHRFVYDSVEDFLEEFATSMDEFSAMGEDLADRFHKTLGTKTPPPMKTRSTPIFRRTNLSARKGTLRKKWKKQTKRSPLKEEPCSIRMVTAVKTRGHRIGRRTARRNGRS